MSEESVTSEQLSVSSEEEVEKLKEVNGRQAEEIEALKGQVESQTKAERREPPDKTPGFLENADDPLKRNRSACADALLPNQFTILRKENYVIYRKSNLFEWSKLAGNR